MYRKHAVWCQCAVVFTCVLALASVLSVQYLTVGVDVNGAARVGTPETRRPQPPMPTASDPEDAETEAGEEERSLWRRIEREQLHRDASVNVTTRPTRASPRLAAHTPASSVPSARATRAHPARS